MKTVPGLFFVTMMVLAKSGQLIVGPESGLHMKCPPHFNGTESVAVCVVNVTRLAEEGCHLGDFMYVVERTVGQDDVITSCPIHRSNRTCSTHPMLCPSCEPVGEHLIHVGFGITYFTNQTVGCDAYCPRKRLMSSNNCTLELAPKHYAIFLGKDEEEEETYGLRMQCPKAIHPLPIEVTCKVNVTRLVQDGCHQPKGQGQEGGGAAEGGGGGGGGSGEEVIYIMEQTEGVDDFITICQIDTINRTCPRSLLCPSCYVPPAAKTGIDDDEVDEGDDFGDDHVDDRHLVHVGFPFTRVHADHPNFPNHTVRCVAFCPQELVASDSSCFLKLGGD